MSDYARDEMIENGVLEDEDLITINLRDGVLNADSVAESVAPVITEMDDAEKTAFERRMETWFANNNKELDDAVKVADDRVAKRKRTDICGKNFIFYLSGDSPLSSKEDLERLKKQMCTNTKNIKFIAVGAPEKSENGRIHQHAICIMDKPVRFHKIPRVVKADGSEMTMAFAKTTSYSENTGDFKKYIWYMNKGNDDINKCFMVENNNYLTKDGTLPPPEKRNLDADWRTCIELSDLNLALDTMHKWHPSNFPAKEVHFIRRWNTLHYMDNVKKHIVERGLTEWKSDSKQIRLINSWVYKAKDPNNLRPGNLFIIGPSLTGKSEYINRKVVLPFQTFKLRGKLMFDSYDPKIDYDFIILDDMEDVNKEYIHACKTITSGAKGEESTINVKYSQKQVKCAPIIHLMNWEKFFRFMRSAQTTGAYDAWWKDNMDVVIVDDFLFPSENKLDKKLSDEEALAHRFALKQILYKHPNRKVHVENDEGNSEDVEAVGAEEERQLVHMEEEEEEQRRHYKQMTEEEQFAFNSRRGW